MTFPNLREVKRIALDTETTGLSRADLPIGISWATADDHSGYLPWGHAGGNLPEDAVRRWAQTELCDKEIVFQNARFDIEMLRRWGVDLEAMNVTATDTQHQVALLDDKRRRFKLKELAEDFFPGEVDWRKHDTTASGEPLDPSRMATYPVSEIAAYAEQDAKLTLRLSDDVFMPEIVRQDLGRVLALENEVIWVVCEMERNGAPVDVEALRAWAIEAKTELARLTEDLYNATGVVLNPDSSKDWAALLAAKGLQSGELTEKGKPSYSDSALQALAHDKHVSMGRRIARLADLNSRYFNPYSERTKTEDMLYFQLHQLRNDEYGTISGRFSMSNVNLQQVLSLDKQIAKYGDRWIIRKLFRPRSGLWFSADAAQIEYRIMAHYANSPKVLATYAQNPMADYHKIVQDMLAPFKTLGRKEIKGLNFAKIFGAGRNKIAAMLGMPRAESDRFVSIYNRELPEAGQLMDQASHVARVRGYVKTFLGRRARFEDRQRLHKALNAIIQGTAADIMKDRLVALHRANRKSGLGLILRLTVHDEVDGDTPNEDAAIEAHRVLNEQSEKFPLRVPILWTMEIGSTWGDVHKIAKIEETSRRGVA